MSGLIREVPLHVEGIEGGSFSMGYCFIKLVNPFHVALMNIVTT